MADRWTVGFGFMFVEIGLIQRLSAFLGHPVYGLAIGLFGIVVSTGIGSLMSERFPLASYRKILLWLGMLGLYLIVLPFWFPQLVAAFQGGPLIVRALVSLAAIVPAGVLMVSAFRPACGLSVPSTGGRHRGSGPSMAQQAFSARVSRW